MNGEDNAATPKMPTITEITKAHVVRDDQQRLIGIELQVTGTTYTLFTDQEMFPGLRLNPIKGNVQRTTIPVAPTQ